MTKHIVKTYNYFFSFRWLDTTMISLFDYSQKFESFVEKAAQYGYYSDYVEVERV